MFEQEWKHFSLPLPVSAEVRGRDSFQIKENLSDISSLKENHFQIHDSTLLVTLVFVHVVSGVALFLPWRQWN